MALALKEISLNSYLKIDESFFKKLPKLSTYKKNLTIRKSIQKYTQQG